MLLNCHGNRDWRARRQLVREHWTWTEDEQSLLGVWQTEETQDKVTSNRRRKRQIILNYSYPLNMMEESILPNVVTHNDDNGAIDSRMSYSSNKYGSSAINFIPVGKPSLNARKNKPVPSSAETIYFRDGKRKIDYVLAYEEGNVDNATDEKRMIKRDVFIENLMDNDLELEKEDKCLSQDGKTFFLKIYAPWDVLAQYAEFMNLKMPIKAMDGAVEPNQEYTCFPLPFGYDKELIPDDPQYFTCAFNRQRSSQFVINNKDTFFSSAQRSRMVWQILMRTRYSTTDPSKIGIMRLLNNGSFKAAFPIHEPLKAAIPRSISSNVSSTDALAKYQARMQNMFEGAYTRALLHQEWAKWGCWYKKQPLQLVRKYFGVKIGIYFAWLGFYTSMLIPPAIVGVLCFLYGVFTLGSSIPVKDICDINGPGNLTICPLCDKSCRYKRLEDSCFFAEVSYIFDNPATVFFAVFMAFWATTFLEFWKRRQARLVWEWDLSSYDEEETSLATEETEMENNEDMQDSTRPEFEFQVKAKRFNPTTKSFEPYIPFWSKALRIAAASSAVILMVAVVLATVFGVVVYRVVTATALHSSQTEFFKENAKITVAVTAAVMNLIIILILDRLYQKVAVVLTNLERPRTQTEYENSFTFKMFLFQSVNFYSSLIYIAFFKGRGMSIHDSRRYSDYFVFGFLPERCDPAGCLFELCVQLAIVMVGKQVLNNIKEILFPLVVNWWAARKSKANTKQLYTRWEKDYDLRPVDNMTLFYEYLEMVIQYGFITIFVAAFPLAPLFALLNNIVEIRIDAFKFVTQVRRPMAARANSIGAWAQILQILSTIAVLVNAFVIAYTSSFIPEMVYRYQYSENFTLSGYIVNALSQYNTTDFSTESGPIDKKLDNEEVAICWYRDYRNPPNHPERYRRSIQYWHVFAARLAFVVTFEHLVFILTSFLAYIIPDAPYDVRVNLRREKTLAKEALYEAEFQKLKEDRRTSGLKRNRSKSTPNLEIRQQSSLLSVPREEY